MKAIIFGITGQDGSHLADLLLEKGYDVVGVARRCSVDNLSRVKHLEDHENFTVIQGDITDAYSVANIFREHSDVHEVYNLAAQSHVAVSFKQPALTWDITGKGCLNILQTMVDLHVQARFYQASSSEMFGKNYDVRVHQEKVTGHPEECNIVKTKYQDENTKFMPQSPYAIAKCAAHHMTALFREAYGVHASAGILFNHEGPRRGENFVTRKITKWIGDYHNAMDLAKHRHQGPYTVPNYGRIPQDKIDLQYSEKINNIEDTIDLYHNDAIIYSHPKLRLGNLEAFRDWGYAGDYVEAMWMMLQQDEPDDYVICTGETHTIKDFLQVAFACVGIDQWQDYVTIDMEFYRPAEVDYLRGLNNKAVKKLGWKPRHSFQDLVYMMVQADTQSFIGERELNEEV